MEAFLIHPFVTLFVVIDPIGTAPLFASLTQGAAAGQRRAMALRGTFLAAVILIAFAVLGEPLLRALGVGLPAFQVGGGILLLLLSIDMVFARKSGGSNPTEVEEKEAMRREDVSVFPLAFPLIAGPGAMTSVVLLAGPGLDEPTRIGALLGVLLLVLAITLALLLVAGRLASLLGVTGVNVVGRIFGVILAALASQFIMDGLGAHLPLGP